MPRECALPPGVEDHLQQISMRLGRLQEPVHAYIAGGVAIHYHIGARISDDVDIKWSHRVAIPPDLRLFESVNPNDPEDIRIMSVDVGFHDTLGSFPPGWEDRSPEIARFGDLVVHVIDPVDLAVSKVGRFQDRDREDIRALAMAGLVPENIFTARCAEALEHYVGETTFIQYNIRDACMIVRAASPVRNLDDCAP